MSTASVWKFPIPLTPGVTFPIDMPVGSKVLDAQIQHGQESDAYLWALVPLGEERKEQRRFTWVGTGWKLEPPTAGAYVATVQEGTFVWHLFEEVRP